MTILLSLPRFAHQTPDSKQYLALAKYFRGEVTVESLRAPYAFRILVPFLAAHGPSQQLEINFALVNVTATVLAYIIFYYYLLELFKNPQLAAFTELLVVISFPTINYASGVLTDPMGFLYLILSVYALLKKQYLVYAIAATLGVLTREANFLSVGILFVYSTMVSIKLRQGKNLTLYLLGIPPFLAYYLIRIYFGEFEYFWYPTINTFFGNVLRPISWITVLLSYFHIILAFTLVIIINKVKWISVMYLSDQAKSMLVSIALAGVSFYIYSVFSAFMSGRFVWPLYLVLVPSIALLFGETPLYQLKIAPRLGRILHL